MHQTDQKHRTSKQSMTSQMKTELKTQEIKEIEEIY